MSFTLSLLLAVFGALLLVAVLLDDIAARLRVPGILLVLLLGLLTTNDVDARVLINRGITWLPCRRAPASSSPWSRPTRSPSWPWCSCCFSAD